MADNKQSREVDGISRIDGGSEWGLIAETVDGKYYAISETEYRRLKTVLFKKTAVDIDTTQILYEANPDGSLRIPSTENNSEELSVKIDVDVSEAITGLKAVQREAREATKALRELEGAESKTPEVVRPAMVFDKGPGKVVEVSAPIYDLTKVPTKQLHEELAKREGVTEHIVKFPKGNAIIDITNEDSGEYIPMGGPARIIVIKE